MTAGPPAEKRLPGPADGQARWAELLGSLLGLLPGGARVLLVDGPAGHARLFAGRLADEVAAHGTGLRVTTVPGEDADVLVYLRTAPAPGPGQPADPPGSDRRRRPELADIVVDLHDTSWPVIRRVAAPLAARGPWYLTETRAFFACRADTWDAKFGDDGPAYQAAVAEAGLKPGGVAVDVGCGTGRALPPLRAAVGPDGAVLAVDLTPEMLRAARPAAAAAGAALVLGDARALPLADRAADAVFAAGLVNHLPDSTAGLRELARVTRPGGLLILFHPTGRAALAARHGHSVSHDEPLAAGPLRRSAAASGWRLTAYDDAPRRFFAVAERVAG